MATTRGHGRRQVSSGRLRRCGALADLDQMAVGIANVCTYLGSVHLGLGEELGTPRRPLLVCLSDVGDPDVEECAGTTWVGGRGERDRGLVISRAAAVIEDEPGVHDLQDDRVAFTRHRRPEHRSVEVPRAVLVGHYEEVGDDEAVRRVREIAVVHLKPPSENGRPVAWYRSEGAAGAVDLSWRRTSYPARAGRGIYWLVRRRPGRSW